MLFSFKIIQLLQKRCGHSLKYPADIERLALDIETVTGEHIGVNTLKRLMGMIDDEREPRLSTLDVVAHYIGYGDWATLQLLDSASNSSFDTVEGELRVADLQEGKMVEVSYLPDRRLRMTYLGEQRFRIIESDNSKLLKDDIITVSHIVNDYPMLVSHVLREGVDLGSFISGKAKGVKCVIL